MPDERDGIRQAYDRAKASRDKAQYYYDQLTSPENQGRLSTREAGSAQRLQRVIGTLDKDMASYLEEHPWLTEGQQPKADTGPTLMDQAQGYGAMGLVGLAKFLGWPISAIQQMGRDPLPPEQKEQGEGIGPAVRNWAKDMGRPTIVDQALEYTGLTPWAERQAEEAQMGPWGKLAAELLGMGAGGVGAGKMATKGLQKTRYFIYDALDDATRGKVDEALVAGDQAGVVFSRTELAQRGLNDIQIEAYEGVRAVMDRVWKRATATNKALEDAGLKPLGVPDEEGLVGIGQRAGYIPRKWLGDWEIFVRDPQTGEFSKYIRPNLNSSSFANKARANYEVQLLAKDPAYAGKELVVQQFTRKVPSYAAHGLERHGAQGYETANLRDVLRQYVAQEARWEANAKFRIDYAKIMDDAKDTLSPDELGRLDRFFQRAMGKPQWLDMKADEWLNKVPVVKDLVKTSDPTRQITSGIRGWVTHSSLGMLNFGYSVVNSMAVSQHVYPGLARYAGQLGQKLGQKIDDTGLVKQAMAAYFKGMKHRFGGGAYTPEAKLMDELVHKGIVDIQYWTETAPSVSGKLLGSESLRKGVELAKEGSLLLGRTTEEFSRVVAAISGYNLAGRAGMNHEAALKFAQKFTDETMVRFGRATKPGIYAGQIGGTLGQFRTFQQAMIENLYLNTFEGNAKSAMRAWGTTIGMGGVAGLPGAISFDRMYTQLTGTSPIEEFTRVMKDQVGVGMAATTGAMSELPGMLGMDDWNVDLSGRVGIGSVVPSGIDDFAFYNKIVEPLTELFVHADPQAALRAMHLNAPGLNYYINTRENAGGQVEYLDKQGRVIYRPEGGQKVLESLGLMPQERGDTYRFGSLGYGKTKHALEENKAYYEAVSRGEVPEEKPKSVSSGGLKRSLKSRKTPSEERTIKRAYKHLRRDLVESPLRPSK